MKTARTVIEETVQAEMPAGVTFRLHIEAWEDAYQLILMRPAPPFLFQISTRVTGPMLVEANARTTGHCDFIREVALDALKHLGGV